MYIGRVIILELIYIVNNTGLVLCKIWGISDIGDTFLLPADAASSCTKRPPNGCVEVTVDQQ